MKRKDMHRLKRRSHRDERVHARSFRPAHTGSPPDEERGDDEDEDEESCANKAVRCKWVHCRNG